MSTMPPNRRSGDSAGPSTKRRRYDKDDGEGKTHPVGLSIKLPSSKDASGTLVVFPRTGLHFQPPNGTIVTLSRGSSLIIPGTGNSGGIIIDNSGQLSLSEGRYVLGGAGGTMTPPKTQVISLPGDMTVPAITDLPVGTIIKVMVADGHPSGKITCNINLKRQWVVPAGGAWSPFHSFKVPDEGTVVIGPKGTRFSGSNIISDNIIPPGPIKHALGSLLQPSTQDGPMRYNGDLFPGSGVLFSGTIVPESTVLPGGTILPGSAFHSKNLTYLPGGSVLPKGTEIPCGTRFPVGTPIPGE